MEQKWSCCGTVCTECEYYPEDCRGCGQIKGKVFWLEYTGEEVCPIYQCCVQERQYEHCGRCAELPCQYYDTADPTKSKEENDMDYRRQMENLRQINS